ncbi:hypothetical protein JK636_04750 [Clostridium sp. YIM B02515]|uniref:Uncharacterized protein n=1 Tax=Clostridium rhizosphaerae TaxID=2803861 RepID=A0ABS1T6U5_9CLOT|nr:hypothetical protein [Clostridium rhizosphaerae]MBL4935064.1 hypothetical protein [Clostridium rhizosphaerae]
MKSILYRNPVISTIAINFMTMILFIYSINQRITALTISLMVTGVVNRRILDNGINLNKQKKTIIFLSFFISIGIAMLYNVYIHKIRLNQIINGV